MSAGPAGDEVATCIFLMTRESGLSESSIASDVHVFRLAGVDFAGVLLYAL